MCHKGPKTLQHALELLYVYQYVCTRSFKVHISGLPEMVVLVVLKHHQSLPVSYRYTLISTTNVFASQVQAYSSTTNLSFLPAPLYFKSLQAKGLQSQGRILNARLRMSNDSPHKVAKYVALKTLIVCSFAAFEHTETYSISLKSSNLNNYFDFHVCLSIRLSVCLCVCPKSSSNACSSTTKCY